MNDFPNSVKETLLSLVRSIAGSLELYVKNPGKDFTRDRKLTLENVILLIICMGGNSVYSELLESKGLAADTATTSAFVQQRDKILRFAFEFLLREFTRSFDGPRRFMGYRLLAADGSDLPIATNPGDTETYYNTGSGRKGYNLLHLNATYDLLNRMYADICVQPGNCQNENKALCDMVGRSGIEGNVIVLCDRNYESYNNFAHIENRGWHYVIRVKDIESRCGILKGLGLRQSGEFDVRVRRILTKKLTNEIKAQPDVYKYISSKSTFDFLDRQTSPFYPISFRVVRIMLENGAYESVVTNLDELDFPPSVIKKLYGMRWGIETSFRELKYTVGLTSFHARKREYIVQEVFARVIMYNFTEIITSHVVISKTGCKYPQRVNFTVAVFICKRFLRTRDNARPPDVEALIRKNTLPVRSGRSNVRKLRNQTAVSFLYRVA